MALYEQHYYLNRFLLAILTVPADAGIPVHDLFGEEDDPFRQASQLLIMLLSVASTKRRWFSL